MKKTFYTLFLSTLICLGISCISVAAANHTFIVPRFGQWTSPSPSVYKGGSQNSGYMVRYNEAFLPQYGDLTAGGTSTRISKTEYFISNSDNLSYSAHARLYYASGQDYHRYVSCRLRSSSIEPSNVSTVVSWGPDWY